MGESITIMKVIVKPHIVRIDGKDVQHWIVTTTPRSLGSDRSFADKGEAYRYGHMLVTMYATQA